MIENRLWRPAAQRSVHNARGYLQAQHSAWSAASNTSRSAATNLVNAYLSHSDVGAMDLGVLRDMEGIVDKARIKLRARQEMYLQQYRKSYDVLENAVLEMRSVAASMRTYSKDSGGGALIEFTKVPMVDGDVGDGGGVAVFATLPLRAFEELANDIVSMFEKELKVKWLLASEFHHLVYQSSEGASSKGKEVLLQSADPLIDTHMSKLNKGDEVDEDSSAIRDRQAKPPSRETLQSADPLIDTHMSKLNKGDEVDEDSSAIRDRQAKPPSRETLQVYLTALLAEVHVNKDRIEEVFRLWSEEMNGGLVGSPQR